MSDACPVCGGKPRNEVKYISMCDKHKEEQLEDDRRLYNMPDLIYTQAQWLLPKTLDDIRFKLSQQPTKSLIIKVIP